MNIHLKSCHIIRLGRVLGFWGICILALSSCSSSMVGSTSAGTAISRTTKKQKKDFMHTIVIDAGHGGFDLGAHHFGKEEKEINLKTAHLLRKHLINKGFRVVLTRSRDEYLPLKKRVEIANTNRCQALISIHYNSAKNPQAQGIEVFYAKKGDGLRKKLSKSMANKVLQSALLLTKAKSRGVKEGNFCVIRDTKIPAILIEGGFMTHEQERKKLQNDNYLNEIAKGIADGVEAYFWQI